MKKCPFCAEEIQDEAIKCRYCGEYLKKRRKWPGCLAGCLFGFVILAVGCILLAFINLLILRLVLGRVLDGVAHPEPYSLPFFGQGFEGMVSRVADFFSGLWGILRGFAAR